MSEVHRVPHVVAVCRGGARTESMRKPEVDRIDLSVDLGVEGDTHAGPGPRQVALMTAAGLEVLSSRVRPITPGMLGENIVLAGIAAQSLQPGALLRFPSGAAIEVTLVRNPCVSLEHEARGLLRAAVGHSGYFARVLQSGPVYAGDACTLKAAPPAAVATS